MGTDTSRSALFEFLDYLSDKGLMAKATVSARKASAGKVLSVLSDDEAKNVINIDLDDIMTRFQNLKGKTYTPGSLNTYQSRTKSALDDFESYLQNPMGFRPSTQTRDRKSKSNNAGSSKRKKEKLEDTSTNEPTHRASIHPPSASILPIPIRSDVTVHVQGLPYDLTETEANKIANVIRAMATPA